MGLDYDKINSVLKLAKEKDGITSFSTKDIKYQFNINILDDIVELIHNRSKSSYLQIYMKVIQDLAYILAYSGIKGTSFYHFDISPSGSSKTLVKNLSRQLILNPVFEFQQQKLNDIIDSLEDNDKDVSVPLVNCIHLSDISIEALYEAFEYTKAQYISLGEVGLRIRSGNDKVLNFITDKYGASIIDAPTFKNRRTNKILSISGTALFFSADSCFEYIGAKAFFENLNGGLINRCMIVYNSYMRKFEELPVSYSIFDSEVEHHNAIVSRLIRFIKNNRTIDISFKYKSYQSYIDFSRYIYDLELQSIQSGSKFSKLYVRLMQNFEAILQTLHFLKCFESNKIYSTIEEEIVKLSIGFIKLQISKYDDLIHEVSGELKYQRDVTKQEKLYKYIDNKSLPLSIRTVQQNTHKQLSLSTKEIRYFVDQKYKLSRDLKYIVGVK